MTREEDEAASDLVRFFRALSADVRADYQRLADLDRTFGEDVRAEQRARSKEQRT